MPSSSLFQHIVDESFDYVASSTAPMPVSGNFPIQGPGANSWKLKRVRAHMSMIVYYSVTSPGASNYDPGWWTSMQAFFGLWCDEGNGGTPGGLPVGDGPNPPWVIKQFGTPRLYQNPTPPAFTVHQEYAVYEFGISGTVESEAQRSLKVPGAPMKMWLTWNLTPGVLTFTQNGTSGGVTSFQGGHCYLDMLWHF